MTPRRLLNSRQVGERLGPPGKPLSNRAITQRLARPFPTVPEPDFVIEVPGRGEVHGWLPNRKDLVPRLPAPDDPALLGDDPSSLPDSFLIGPRQFGALTGWSYQYVLDMRSQSGRRRALGTSDGTDMPPEDEKRGNSPRWRLATWRTWQKAVKAARGQDISEEKRP